MSVPARTDAARMVHLLATDHAQAWCDNDPDRIGALFALDGQISVNGGEPHVGRPAIVKNARSLLAQFPGLTVRCHETRHAGRRAVFVWTLEGRHAESGNTVVLPGWHEWELDDDMRVTRCRGFYDAEDMARQIEGG